MPADFFDSVTPQELDVRLREGRSVRGWNQEQAAEALGVARTSLQQQQDPSNS